MSANRFKAIKNLDPEILRIHQKNDDLAMRDGALEKKFKLLIVLAIDASKGSTGGVKALTQQALEAGASKEEIAETLRVAHFVSGVGVLHTAARALEGLF